MHPLGNVLNQNKDRIRPSQGNKQLYEHTGFYAEYYSKLGLITLFPLDSCKQTKIKQHRKSTLKSRRKRQTSNETME